MKKSLLFSAALFLVMVLLSVSVCAQNAVKWSASVKMNSKTEGVITLVGNIEKGWHVYGFNQDPDGPVSTEIKRSAPSSVKFNGSPKYSPKLISTMDDMFGVKVTYWENKVTFTQKFKIDKGLKSAPVATFSITYMACNDESCQPPKTEDIKVTLQ